MSSTVIITSDLHHGVTNEKVLRKFEKQVRNHNPDIFIIAGDIGRGYDFTGCLHIFKDVAPQKALILGNHDLWTSHSQVTSKMLWEKILPETCESYGWTHLEENDIVVIGDETRTAIIGSLAWYDYSGRSTSDHDDIIRLRKSAFNNDGRYMDKDWNDVEFAGERRKALVKRLHRLESDDTINQVIVVTHVPIFPCQHIKRPGDQLGGDAYFYHYTLGQDVAMFSKVTQVVSGHTHRKMDEILERDDMNDIRVRVVPTDYHKPKFISLEVE